MSKPVGPYSPVVEAGEWVVVSGQVGAVEGKLVDGGFEGQCNQALGNLGALLASVGCTLDDVVKATVFIRHMTDYPRMNELYCEAFGDHRPARSAIGVAELPLGALFEVEAWARRAGH